MENGRKTKSGLNFYHRFLQIVKTQINWFFFFFLNRLPPPNECDLYYVNRDTLFSYHKDSELFLQVIWCCIVRLINISWLDVSWRLGINIIRCLHIFLYSDICSEWWRFMLLLTTRTLPTTCNLWQMPQHTICLFCLVCECLALLYIDLLATIWFLLTVQMQALLMKPVINFQIFCASFRLISTWPRSLCEYIVKLLDKCTPNLFSDIYFYLCQNGTEIHEYDE